MAKTKLEKKREEFREHLRSIGYREDRFGHFHKGQNRWKMQACTVRFERKIDGSWFKRHASTLYLRDFHTDSQGKISFRRNADA